MIRQNILVLPFQYMFQSRNRLWINKVSFVAIVIAPISVNVMMMCVNSFDLLELFLGFISLFSVYEIGYIYNDVYSIEKEINGRQWMDNEHFDNVKRKYPVYIASRVMYTCFSIFLLYLLECKNVHWYVLFLGILYLSYTAHNYIRNFYNIVTFTLLNVLKYSTILILFTTGWKEFTMYSFFMFMEIVLERTIEYGVIKNYIYVKSITSDLDKFRINYCLIILGISVCLCAFSRIYLSFLIGTLYVFGYRVLCYICSRFGKLRNRTKIG